MLKNRLAQKIVRHRHRRYYCRRFIHFNRADGNSWATRKGTNEVSDRGSHACDQRIARVASTYIQHREFEIVLSLRRHEHSRKAAPRGDSRELSDLPRTVYTYIIHNRPFGINVVYNILTSSSSSSRSVLNLCIPVNRAYERYILNCTHVTIRLERVEWRLRNIRFGKRTCVLCIPLKTICRAMTSYTLWIFICWTIYYDFLRIVYRKMIYFFSWIFRQFFLH